MYNLPRLFHGYSNFMTILSLPGWMVTLDKNKSKNTMLKLIRNYSVVVKNIYLSRFYTVYLHFCFYMIFTMFWSKAICQYAFVWYQYSILILMLKKSINIAKEKDKDRITISK